MSCALVPAGTWMAVSYTHLDVYKRQAQDGLGRRVTDGEHGSSDRASAAGERRRRRDGMQAAVDRTLAVAVQHELHP